MKEIRNFFNENRWLASIIVLSIALIVYSIWKENYAILIMLTFTNGMLVDIYNNTKNDTNNRP